MRVVVDGLRLINDGNFAIPISRGSIWEGPGGPVFRFEIPARYIKGDEDKRAFIIGENVQIEEAEVIDEVP